MSLVDISVRTPYRFKIEFKEGAVWSMASLYLSCLKKYDAGKIKKVVIEIVDKSVDDSIEDLVDVLRIQREFDFKKYFASGKYDKKKMLVDVIQDGLMSIAKQRNWDTDPLIDAYRNCLDKGFEHQWLRKDKLFLSPDRKNYAGVFCKWDTDELEVFALFFNKEKDEIKRTELFRCKSIDAEPMGKMGWDKATNAFYLYSKDEKQKWTAKL